MHCFLYLTGIMIVNLFLHRATFFHAYNYDLAQWFSTFLSYGPVKFQNEFCERVVLKNQQKCHLLLQQLVLN